MCNLTNNCVCQLNDQDNVDMLNFTGIFFTLSPDPPLYVVVSSFWKLASSNQTY